MGVVNSNRAFDRREWNSFDRIMMYFLYDCLSVGKDSISR